VSAPAREDGGPLVFALCHEVGNLLAAVRLRAHLVDEELGRRELAAASVEIDDLCARASALLAQVRPILSGPGDPPRPVPAERVLSAVQQTLDDQGVRGVSLRLEMADDLPDIRVDPEVLHPVLLTLIQGAVEAASPRGAVVVRAEPSGGDLAIAIRDDGDEEEDLSDWRSQPRRGRPLAWAAAERILEGWSGTLVVSRRDGGGTHVRVALPAA